MTLPTFSIKKFTFKKRYIALLLIVVLIVFSSIRNKQERDAGREFFTVEQGGVVETITLAGDIDMKDRVDLGFGISGRVSRVLVIEGQEVSKGDILAELSMGQLQAELREAEARVKQTIADQDVADVNLTFAYQNLQNTIKQQDTLVESARRALFNESLTAYSLDEGDDAPAPTISGTYLGDEEGEYYISVYSSGSNSGFSFNLSGLEGGFGEAFTSNPGPLGEQGLFVQFDEDGRYSRTDWVVPIPNTRSVNYTAKKNAYDQALTERERVIASAEDEYLQALALENNSTDMLSSSDAERLAAEAAADSVRAKMSDGYIRAPFDGIVGRIDINPGEIVSANTSYITLVGAREFELTLDVPEIDVAKLVVGDPVSITLDAYGADALWDGVIAAIDVIDTIVDGVPVYKTTVLIENPDERIRVGMSAKARILATEKQNILRAPLYFFTRTSEGYTTLVMEDEKKSDEREVVLGLVGSDGFVEIISGLTEGDILVHNAE